MFELYITMENFNFVGRSRRTFRTKKSLLMIYLSMYFAMHLNALAVESRKTGQAQNTPSTSNNVCATKGCTDAAKAFLYNIDKSVKPCNNFYKFACGNFIKKEVLTEGNIVREVFSITRDKVEAQLRSILEGNIDDSQPRAFKIVQKYYKLCMDTAQIEKNSENDLRGILKSLNGWPVLEGKSWDQTKFDWKNTTYALGKMGYNINYLMRLYPDIDLNDSTKNLLYIDQGWLGTDQEFLFNGSTNAIVQAYFKYMVDFAVLFGAKLQQARKELTKSLNFEIQLAKISLSSKERNNAPKLYTKMKIKELENKYKGVPWLEYFNNLAKPKRPLTDDDEVMVGPEKFFKNFGPLLAKTPKRTIANYLMWSVADSSSEQMSKRVQKLEDPYNLLYAGTAARRPLWKRCLARIGFRTAIALGSMYVRKFFDERSKAEVLAMVSNIRSTFKRIIEKVDWMTSKTKKVALDKLKNIKPYIGYPRELLDNKKINEQFNEVVIDPKSYLKTALSFAAINLKKDFETLQKPVNKSDWTSHGAAATVNSFYNAPENSIKFPAGILQGLFFSKDRPKYLNYGAIGMLIGHELTHGFDDEGSNYDKHGNLNNWWDPETKRKFNQKAQGIVNQYNKFRVKEVGLNVSGKLTEDENIADNGGYKEAYQAYNEWSKKNGPEPILPGLPYTARQLFWISAANLWCIKILPETLRNGLLFDTHSPGQYRVNGPLQNRLQFSVDFNCSVGSPMNPVKKYGVW